MLKKLFNIVRNELGDGYGVGSNISYSWMWGSLSGIFLVIQIVTGLFLSMHYAPDTNLAFLSVEHIMRDVPHGWLIRYMHSNGASFFFLSMYMHVGKNLYFKLYLNNKFAWLSGIVIFLLSMATAFIGYVLPWGQMSYWGATVITSLFSVIPAVGPDLVQWLWGGFSVDNPTLNRFYSLHFLLPFVILALVILHLFFLHHGNSSGSKMFVIEDKMTFYPYLFLKDGVGILGVLFIYFVFVFFHPNALGHPDNYIPANPLVTPAHIVPEWYFLPFYAILRAVPDKLGGAVLMGLSILILALLPFFDTTYFEKNYLFNIFFLISFWVFIGSVVLLGWLGAQPIEYPYSSLAVFATICYFGYFFFLFFSYVLSIFLQNLKY